MMMSIQPGAFLDALIAQVVFGITILGFTECQVSWSYPHRWEALIGCEPWSSIRPVFIKNECVCPDDGGLILGHYSGCLSVVPQYSTDITHAWTITDKFPLFSLLKRGDYWMAITDTSDAWSKSSSLAICLAALGG